MLDWIVARFAYDLLWLVLVIAVAGPVWLVSWVVGKAREPRD